MEDYTAQINTYIKQLSDLGYYSYQIDRIIKDAIGTNRLNKLSQEQERYAAEALAEYIQFALKCRHTS